MRTRCDSMRSTPSSTSIRSDSPALNPISWRMAAGITIRPFWLILLLKDFGLVTNVPIMPLVIIMSYYLTNDNFQYDVILSISCSLFPVPCLEQPVADGRANALGWRQRAE